MLAVVSNNPADVDVDVDVDVDAVDVDAVDAVDAREFFFMVDFSASGRCGCVVGCSIVEAGEAALVIAVAAVAAGVTALGTIDNISVELVDSAAGAADATGALPCSPKVTVTGRKNIDEEGIHP